MRRGFIQKKKKKKEEELRRKYYWFELGIHYQSAYKNKILYDM